LLSDCFDLGVKINSSHACKIKRKSIIHQTQVTALQ
jgi:hypothetical protein